MARAALALATAALLALSAVAPQRAEITVEVQGDTETGGAP